MIDTLVSLDGGNPGQRSKYCLNDFNTAKKLKKAAKKKDRVVEFKSGTITMELSTGAYIATVLPLLKIWERIVGCFIEEEYVDNMVIKVDKIEPKIDQGGTIEGYIVKLVVEGQTVTVTLFDTKLSLMVQAGSILEPYCRRVLIPYLEEMIRRCTFKIKEINTKVLSHGSRQATPRLRQQQEVLTQAQSILELPSTPRAPRLRTFSAPSTPVTLALPPPSPLQQARECLAPCLPGPPPARLPPPAEDVLPDALPSLLPQGPPQTVQEAGTAYSTSGQAALEAAGVTCKCTKCEHEAASVLELLKHMNENHTEVRPDVTDLTASGRVIMPTPKFSMTFNLDQLDNSILTSDEETDDDPNEEFVDARNANDNGMEYTCNLCQYKPTDKQDLNIHVTNEHTSKQLLQPKLIEFNINNDPSPSPSSPPPPSPLHPPTLAAPAQPSLAAPAPALAGGGDEASPTAEVVGDEGLQHTALSPSTSVTSVEVDVGGLVNPPTEQSAEQTANVGQEDDDEVNGDEEEGAGQEVDRLSEIEEEVDSLSRVARSPYAGAGGGEAPRLLRGSVSRPRRRALSGPPGAIAPT